jgi:DNA-binding transcriptional LysR family regulator
MDLLHALGTFIRVAETGSFSAVARETGTSHSAATRLIGQLEDHFGVRLFHRTTRRISLTEDGQDLLGHARHLLDAASEMEGALGRQRASPTGLVRLGLPVAAATLLVPRLRGLLERHAGLAVELVVRDQFNDLVEERLDVALHVGQPADTSLVARAMGVYGRVAVAAPSYLERRGAPREPADLQGHACIVHDIGPDSARWQFAGADGPVQVTVSGPFRANNSASVHQAALAGYGIAILPELQVLDDIRAGRLYGLLPEYPSGRAQVFVVYPSRRHLAPRTRVVIDFLVDGGRRDEARLADIRVWGENENTWLV